MRELRDELSQLIKTLPDEAREALLKPAFLLNFPILDMGVPRDLELCWPPNPTTLDCFLLPMVACCCFLWLASTVNLLKSSEDPITFLLTFWFKRSGDTDFLLCCGESETLSRGVRLSRVASVCGWIGAAFLP